MLTPRIVEVAEANRSQGLRWFLAEELSGKESGIIVYMFRELRKPCDFDDWYPDENAFNEAMEAWGIAPEDWRPYEGPDIR